jgi:hypothetical protein
MTPSEMARNPGISFFIPFYERYSSKESQYLISTHEGIDGLARKVGLLGRFYNFLHETLNAMPS